MTPFPKISYTFRSLKWKRWLNNRSVIAIFHMIQLSVCSCKHITFSTFPFLYFPKFIATRTHIIIIIHVCILTHICASVFFGVPAVHHSSLAHSYHRIWSEKWMPFQGGVEVEIFFKNILNIGCLHPGRMVQMPTTRPVHTFLACRSPFQLAKMPIRRIISALNAAQRSMCAAI